MRRCPRRSFVRVRRGRRAGFINFRLTAGWLTRCALADVRRTRGDGLRSAPPTRNGLAGRMGRVRERQPDGTAPHRARPQRRARGTRARPRALRLQGGSVEREYYSSTTRAGRMDRSRRVGRGEVPGAPGASDAERARDDGYHGDYAACLESFRPRQILPSSRDRASPTLRHPSGSRGSSGRGAASRPRPDRPDARAVLASKLRQLHARARARGEGPDLPTPSGRLRDAGHAH